ncbi:hypothetical protein V6617_09770 [Pelagibacterium nitratireducens]|jgi:hypothetical protein|uniref:Uncharacterized protein n=1 Tax=Pelagibacterium nitratireducens TaxID=1046114 RepID=A0ABZ2I2E4_9HYPH
MAALYRALSPFAFFFLLSTVPAFAQDFNTMPVDQLRAEAPNAHPSAYYVLASRLYDRGDKDEAVFWFYAGQLRYRTHIACNPDLPPDGDPALFSALSEVIGSEINLYAFGDLERLLETIDAVIDWDQSTPNGYAPDADCATARVDVLTGLNELKTHIAENADDIRAQRLSNGLGGL